MSAGDSDDDLTRWLRNFFVSHAKRVDPRIEVELDAGDARAGRPYGARLRLGERVTPTAELDAGEAAARRWSLAWCSALAERILEQARGLLAGTVESDVGAR